MRRSEGDPVAAVAEVSRRLVPEAVRDLFLRLCREIALFPGRIEVDVTPFDVQFFEPPGFRVSVSPYRDLFRVSIECPRRCDVRVSDEEGYIAALDLALKSFLDSRGGSDPPGRSAEARGASPPAVGPEGRSAPHA